MICSWFIAARPGAFPTSTRSAAGGREVEEHGRRQAVVDDDIGAAQQLFAAARQESGVTGSGTDEVHRHGATPSASSRARPPRCVEQVARGGPSDFLGNASVGLGAQHDVTVERREEHLERDRSVGRWLRAHRTEGCIRRRARRGTPVPRSPPCARRSRRSLRGGRVSPHHRHGIPRRARLARPAAASSPVPAPRRLRRRGPDVPAPRTRRRSRRSPRRRACADASRCCRATGRMRGQVGGARAGPGGARSRCRCVHRSGMAVERDADERVARVGPFRNRREDEAGRGHGRQVLGRVHRDVGPAVEHGLLHLFHEDALSTHAMDVGGLVGVAVRLDEHVLDIATEARADVLGLPAREPAARVSRCASSAPRTIRQRAGRTARRARRRSTRLEACRPRP